MSLKIDVTLLICIGPEGSLPLQQKAHQSYLFSGAWQRFYIGTADYGSLFRSAVLLVDIDVSVNIGINVIGIVGDVRVHVRPGGNVAGAAAAAAALSVLARHSPAALSIHPLVVSHPLHPRHCRHRRHCRRPRRSAYTSAR